MNQNRSFSFQGRQEALSTLDGAEYDVVVVGGGIVGAGAAREFSLRGLKTLLVEKRDFAWGTSSRSSKLIHGGLRYLEMMDFGLVFESLAERQWLLESQPHLVQPLEFVLPAFEKDSGLAKTRPSWLLGLGLWLYDSLSLFRTPFFHGWYGAEDLSQKFPGIRRQGLKGGYYYADAQMLDDEMVLECLADAHRRGATCLNYLEATRVGAHEVALQDRWDPQGRTYVVRAQQVVVCVGPWTQKWGDAHVDGGSQRQLKPSKGIHLVLPWKRLPVESCLVLYAPDGRIVFVIPRRDFGTGAEVILVGTTDAPYEGDLDDIRSSDGEEQYLLKVLNNYFPEARVTQQDCLSRFAGVRPLLDDGAQSEAKTSREHEIWRNDHGVYFVAGGKYTTFRPMSQEIVDFVRPETKGQSGAKARSHEPLSDAQEYWQRLKEGQALWGKFTTGWVEEQIAHRMVCSLEDLVFRRGPFWMAGAQLPDDVLETLAQLCGARLGWTPSETAYQKSSVAQKLRELSFPRRDGV